MNHEELCQLAERNFKSLPSIPSQLPELKPCRYTGAEMRARDDDMPFAHIAMAVEVRRGRREGNFIFKDAMQWNLQIVATFGTIVFLPSLSFIERSEFKNNM